MIGRFTLKQIKAMPVLDRSQFDNLVYDREGMRVWVSRMGPEDGAPYADQVTVEKYIRGSWQPIDKYNPRTVGVGIAAAEAVPWVDMTYGQLPSLADFELRLRNATDDEGARLVADPPRVFWMTLVDDAEISAVKRVATRLGKEITIGPDREAPWKTAVELRTIKGLYRMIEGLVQQWNQGDEGAGTLASSIMYVLRYEWI